MRRANHESSRRALRRRVRGLLHPRYDVEDELMLSEIERAELEEIRRAFHRIDDGSYGLCERCGHPVDETLLSSVPWARFCRRCDSQLADTAIGVSR